MSWFGAYIKYLGERIDDAIQVQIAGFLLRGNNLIYLDVGCDDGKKTIKRGSIIGTKNILGLEVEKTRVAKTARKGIKVYNADLNKRWPLKAQSIDCITATEVVEHLVDLDNFFSEAKRILKPGGTIIISTENLASYHNIFALILGIQPYTGPYLSRIHPIGHKPHGVYYQNDMNKTMFPHLNVMTTKALIQLLGSFGFKVEQVKGVGFYPFLPFIANVLAGIDTYHASYCVVSGRKEV